MHILPGEQLKKVIDAERMRSLSLEYAQRPNPGWNPPKDATPIKSTIYAHAKRISPQAHKILIRRKSMVQDVRSSGLPKWVEEQLERTIAQLQSITDSTTAQHDEDAIRRSLDRLRGIKNKVLSKNVGEGTSKSKRDIRPERETGRRERQPAVNNAALATDPAAGQPRSS